MTYDAVAAILRGVVDVGVCAMPAPASVSVTVRMDNEYVTTEASDGDARALDAVQYAASTGPCVNAIAGDATVRTDKGAPRRRWAAFCALADDLGVAGTLAIPLHVDGRAAGALNVYTRTPRPFSDYEVALADALAVQASAVLGNALALLEASEVNTQLAEAVASRQVIGEAKGILMERERCTRDEAFDILRRASQRENRRVREIAEDIVTATEQRAVLRNDG